MEGGPTFMEAYHEIVRGVQHILIIVRRALGVSVRRRTDPYIGRLAYPPRTLTEQINATASALKPLPCRRYPRLHGVSVFRRRRKGRRQALSRPALFSAASIFGGILFYQQHGPLPVVAPL